MKIDKNFFFYKSYIKNYNKETKIETYLSIYNQYPLYSSFFTPFYFWDESNWIFKNTSLINFSYIKLKYNFLSNFDDYQSSLPEYDTDMFNKLNSLEEFSYLKKSSFISFFMSNFIDVPICFKKIRSLRSKNFELPILKFSNFLMKKGKREKIIRILIKSFLFYFLIYKNEFFKKTKTINFYSYYLIYNNIYLNNKPNFLRLFENQNSKLLNMNTNLLMHERQADDAYFFKNFFISRLFILSPIFNYFIYNVDKNIRKFSRGKSGKYVFVWKYIAPYKRIYVTLRLICKDIKFNQSQKLHERIWRTFENLNDFPEKSFAWKAKNYSYNYVFKNFRKSLMTNLKTIIK